MARTLQTMLDERAAALVGRERERAVLLELIERETPLVAVVHGIAGVGKSTLLQAAAVDARARGATVIALDGRAFEPTERGLLAALGDALAGHDGRVLLTIDAYERLRLLDDWLRQRFVPELPEHVRLLLAGRDAPAAWQRELGDLVRVVRLDNLAEDAVLRPMVDQLAGHYLAGLDPPTRRALDAASVVRRTTLTLLQAMLPDEDADAAFERVRALPFVELGPDGLHLHDTVRTATSALLQAADPARHRAHRRAAWARLRSELRTAGRPDLWRYTADMLYLVENPIVRDAFFPSGSGDDVTEPARPDDREAILAMDLDPHVGAWWDMVPEAFRVVRNGAGTVRGFSTLCQTQDVPRALLRQDPIAQACREHLRRDPVPSGQRVLLNRHAYAAERSATAMLWLDTKRAYLELRPHLRRLYVPASDPAAALAALAPLGFRRLDVGPHALLMNDFGPGSVDGWLSDVVGRELQADEADIVDADGRRLVLDGRAIDLSRLELGVLRHLQQRDGAAVTREELLREVWGHQWTGGSSNVVEVVVSSLRRKLGDRAGALETVRGVGYRLGPLD